MRNRSYGGRRLGLKEMARRGLIPREDDAEGERLWLKEMARRGLIPREDDAEGQRRGGTRISAQSFSAGNAAWKGRVGEDRSAPNSFGNNFTSLRTMWTPDGGLNGANSLMSRWGADGRINSADEQRASYGRRTGLRPAGQPQTSATVDRFKDPLKAPAGVAGADAERSFDTYGSVAVEAAGKGAGDRGLMAAAGSANAGLTRTGTPVYFERDRPSGVSGGTSRGVFTNSAGLQGLYGTGGNFSMSSPGVFYVPRGGGDITGPGGSKLWFGGIPPESDADRKRRETMEQDRLRDYSYSLL